MIFALLVLSPLASCSVKEDRGVCPCHVLVDVDEFIRAGFKDALFSFRSGSLVYGEDAWIGKSLGVGHEYALPRKPFSSAVVSGLKNTIVRGDSLVTPYGAESDPLWLHCGDILCDADELRVVARPHKQYCRLTLMVTGLNPEEEYDRLVRVIGDCSSIDMYSGRALEGDFSAYASPVGDGTLSVLIPRQRENELGLEIICPDDGSVDCSIDLGRVFEEQAYDWDREDLQDVRATIDRSSFEVRLEIGSWDYDDIFGNVQI